MITEESREETWWEIHRFSLGAWLVRSKHISEQSARDVLATARQQEPHKQFRLARRVVVETVEVTEEP